MPAEPRLENAPECARGWASACERSAAGQAPSCKVSPYSLLQPSHAGSLFIQSEHFFNRFPLCFVPFPSLNAGSGSAPDRALSVPLATPLRRALWPAPGAPLGRHGGSHGCEREERNGEKLVATAWGAMGARGGHGGRRSRAAAPTATQLPNSVAEGPGGQLARTVGGSGRRLPCRTHR